MILELYFYRGSKPNFGDELNSWMWPRLMEGVWDSSDNSIFVGIGSIIFDNYPKEKKKIVFGAGYGGYTALPKIDDRWEFFFVRGKLTADAVNVNHSLALGDSAILLRSCVDFQQSIKRHKISFMPHWKTIPDGSWQMVCELAGVNFIDPTFPVEKVLEDIISSELIITEAMHGAIVADALRVPWIPIRPLYGIHSMKWDDWASALAIQLNRQPLACSNLKELLMVYFDTKSAFMLNKIKYHGDSFKYILPTKFANAAAEQLLKVAKISPSLSDDLAIELAHQKMIDKMHNLVSYLGVGKVTL